MEEVKKGTFKEHLRKMLAQLYLWTTQIKPEAFEEQIKKDLCFSYDELIFKRALANEKQQAFELIFDFGDMVVTYILVFKLSDKTNRWVLSEIK